MKQILIILTAAALTAASCTEGGSLRTVRRQEFIIETLNKTTPVKSQGHSSLCWAYAMLATIESDRLMLGDSVNLSADYVARQLLMQRTTDAYTAAGHDSVTLRGTAPLLLSLIEEYGVMPYDSYRAESNYNAACRRMTALVRQAVNRRTGIRRLRETASSMLDDVLAPVPWHVYMLGAEYTPREFAHSVCLPGEYRAMTSFTHLPFYEDVFLSLPDNRQGGRFHNLPIDTLMNRVTAALRSGHSVCWEGDISEPGFSFKEGTARLSSGSNELSQESRQRMFETFRTTDDHCMELIGLARDRAGNRYFVCKNSWGTDNPYHGLMFMSVEYARMKTVCVVMKDSPR